MVDSISVSKSLSDHFVKRFVDIWKKLNGRNVVLGDVNIDFDNADTAHQMGLSGMRDLINEEIICKVGSSLVAFTRLRKNWGVTVSSMFCPPVCMLDNIKATLLVENSSMSQLSRLLALS